MDDRDRVLRARARVRELAPNTKVRLFQNRAGEWVCQVTRNVPVVTRTGSTPEQVADAVIALIESDNQKRATG